MDYIGRQERLAEAMRAGRLDGLLVTHMANVRYLCGFSGSTGALAVVVGRTGLEAAFFTDGRYTQQARDEVRRAKVTVAAGPAVPEALRWISARKARRVGFEALHMSVGVKEAIAPTLRTGRLVPTRELVEKLRMVKEPGEVAQMRAAASLASSVFGTVVQNIKPGLPENRIAAEL